MNLPEIPRLGTATSKCFPKAFCFSKYVKTVGLFSLMIYVFMGFTTLSTSECDIAHEGTFIYYFEGKEVKVSIHKDLHTEYHEGGKYIIQSKLVWVNDCEFIATCIKNTFPNPAYTLEDQMYVKIEYVYDNEIYFTSTINRFEWKGKMIKVKQG